MPTGTFGTTKFEWNDNWEGKIRISTAEGSTVAVPAEDVLKLVTFAYVLPARQAALERKDWRKILDDS